MENLTLDSGANMFNNFKQLSLKVKQVFWKFQNMNWSPYIYLKGQLSTTAFDKATKRSLWIWWKRQHLCDAND